MFGRRSTPPADLAAVTAAAKAAQDAAEAAHRIAAVAERQAAIISAQADEIGRLRQQLAAARQEADKATAAAGFWYNKADEQRRQTLPARLAANLIRFANPN